MELNNAILVISPQTWDHIKISKHHYASTLADLGNVVYFLSPPSSETAGRGIQSVPGKRGLFTVSYDSKIPKPVRFHCKWLFNLLTKYEVAKLIRSFPHRIDLVWCFDAHFYSSLKIFRAKKSILHVVDKIVLERGREVAKTADLVAAVSKEILAGFDGIPSPRLLVDHGIGIHFHELAKSDFPVSQEQRSPQVGYSGNLMHSAVNRHAMLAMVEAFGHASFHLWGSDVITPIADDGADMPAVEYLERLRSAQNVTLHGAVEPGELAAAYGDMDALLVCYRRTSGFQCDNTHKILEYLASGVAIVSSPISRYRDIPECVVMAKSEDPREMVELLGSVLSELDQWNAPSLANNRKRIALDSTYEARIGEVFERLYG